MIKSAKVSQGRKTAILLVDDHPLVREGLAARIAPQSDWEVCGEAGSARQALALVQTTHPDLAVIDVQLLDSCGIELVQEIHDRFPEVKTLVISAFDEQLYAERALRAGALGYVNKRELQESVIDAMRTVLKGERYLSARMTQRLLHQAVGGVDSSVSDPVARLTNRELEVFCLIGEGISTGAIANRLHLSVHTIDTYRGKLRDKLGVKNGAELTRRAVQWVLENG